MFVVVVILAALTNIADCDSFVKFRFTFRSFQPQVCMTPDFFALYGGALPGSSIPANTICAPGNVRAGHPDFEAVGAVEIAFDLNRESIVKPALEYDESGIGKPRYCNDVTVQSMLDTGEGTVCGRPFTSIYPNGSLLTATGRYPQTSGKDRFDEWYRDVPGVNKRFGASVNFLEEKQVVAGKNRTVFFFDSEDDRFYDVLPGFFPFEGLTEENGGASFDPFEFQTVWTKWTAAPADRPFSFTTEFHSLFTYQGGETFVFRGDDDVFVYINGFLELDLGGRHPRLQGSIILDNLTYSVLEVGKTYTIDLFHAERRTLQSNFLISSTLEEPLSIDDVGVTGFDWPNVNDPNFFSIGSEPKALGVNGSIPLVSIAANTLGNGVRYMFLERKLLLNKGFIIEVGISITGVGSSGFSVLLHNANVENLPLSGRRSRISEFEGIAQEEGSLGLMVNLCKERFQGLTDAANCSQEMSLVANGKTAAVLARTPVVGKLADGRIHVYTIRYTLETQYLEVFIDDSLFLLQSSFLASAFIGNDATTVGISLFDDSIVPTQSPTFEEVLVSISSFRVVVGEFRNDERFSLLDLAVLGSVGAVTFLLVLAGIAQRRQSIWLSLHAMIAFAEDATAVYLLVEKACEVCPGTPAIDLFLIFCGMELVFQTIPHVSRGSILARFVLFAAAEGVQLVLFLNLLADTLNKDESYIFIIYSCIQGGLLALSALTSFLDRRKSGKEEVVDGCVPSVLVTRLLSDWMNTVLINAFPLLTVFVFAQSSVFQEKWYQVLVAQNLWYRAVVVDSMVADLSDEEYNKGAYIWTSSGRRLYRKEWKAWFARSKFLAICSTTHTVLLHFLSASLAAIYLQESPSEVEQVVCFVLFLAFPAAAAYAYSTIRATYSPAEDENKVILEPKA